MEEFKSYMGVKLIEAVVSTKDGQEGYTVKYPDGYVSWSPKEQFELAYLPLTSEGKICIEELRAMTARVDANNLEDGKTTLVKRELVTGFVQYETSSCVDPKNYDPILGADIAVERMDKNLWFALGFILQWAKYGLKNTPKV